MVKPELLAALTSVWPELAQLGVEHLDVFGSEARGEATASSDVDCLVHLRSPSLRVLVDVRDRLERAVGRRVDVVTPGALEGRPRLRARVLAEAVRVA
jgi:hypothetical protein